MTSVTPIVSTLRCALALPLALGCALALAAPPDDAEIARNLKILHKRLADNFVLDEQLPLEPALRAKADSISAAHLARADALLARWMREETVQLGPSDNPFIAAKLYGLVYVRLLNELALWQLDRGDATYEKATLAVLKNAAPSVCMNMGDSRSSDFSTRILRISFMPRAQRDAALKNEAQLLLRWGQARAPLTPWPDPLPQDSALALIAGMQGGARRSARALPPLLAHSLLGDRTPYAAMHRTLRCTLQQWWLQESLRQGVAPAVALNSFRYGTLITINDRFSEFSDSATAADATLALASNNPPSPKLARDFGVTGTTTVRVAFGADGTLRHSEVAARKIVVPGIRGVRPVAFENTFDKASIDYAPAYVAHAKSVGAAPTKFELEWKLDNNNDDKTPPASPASPAKGARP